jgi:hypothetical protein
MQSNRATIKHEREEGMSYEKCSVCKEYGFTDTHKCAPIFYFKHEDWGDDWQEIRGYSFDDAAENFAKRYNENGDYRMMSGDNTVDVLIFDGKTEKKFTVTAEASIDYHVSEVETPTPKL